MDNSVRGLNLGIFLYTFPLKSRRDYTPLMIFRILLMKINGRGKEKKRILKF